MATSSVSSSTGSVSSISGLASGLDTETIIKGLMSIKHAQVDNLTAKREAEENKKDAWGTISSNLLTLQLSAYNLSKTSTFDTKISTVSNQDILSATAGTTAVAGDYTFYVSQLASAHQISSTGFNDHDTTTVGAGTITLELGDGDVQKKTDLNSLNGGNGVTRGSIKITNRAGVSANIDLSMAMYIDDVVNAINNSGLDVTASLNSAGDGLKITDNTGASTSNLKIEEVNNSTTALDLGIKQNVAANTITGSNISYLTGNTSINILNDGLGITKKSFIINDGVHGDTIVSLTSVNTMKNVIDAINAAGTDVTASMSADGKSIHLDSSGAFTVSENGFSSASDLGILNLTSTGDGDHLLASMNSVLLKNLNGGAGITGSSFNIGATTIDISSAVSLSDVLDAINAQSGVTSVAARYNTAKNGLELYSLNSSNFTVSEDSSTTAASLGILGSSSDYKLKGSDLEFKYIGNNVSLSKMNQGAGVRLGTITITNKNGSLFQIDLSNSGSIKTINDVMSAINNFKSVSNVEATINSTGDGILLTDTSGGSGNLVVAELNNGNTAKDLGILGSTSGTTIDGTFEKSISVTSAFTLDDIKDAINALNTNIKASIVNDGSTSPYRLILSSTKSGRIGRMVLDTDISSLNLNTSVDANDAVMVMGSSTAENAVFSTSSTNQAQSFIPGVTITLKQVTGNTPVTLSVANDADSIVTATKDFVTKFNKTLSLIYDQLKYNTDTTSADGPLFADTTLMMIQQEVYSLVNKDVSAVSGDVKSIGQVGITMGLDGQLTLNETTLRAALSENISDVKDFFTFQNNVALTATASSSGADAPWTDNGAKDGNTKVADFASGSTGWQADNGGNYTLDFGSRKELTSLKIYGVNTTSSDVLQNFDIQYWNNGVWNTYTSVSGNTLKDLSVYFPYGLVTDKIRLNNIQGTGSKAKLLDVQAFESSGLAGAADLSLSKMTSAGTGPISSALDGIDNNETVLDDEISSMEERLTIEEDQLRKQYTKLEELMAQMKNTSTTFNNQMTSINANWNYNN
ncbi:MAG: flagellar filament capping protein FliD [Candidatus Margulisbacteria bacterium]|nr:flagellar filament capping protein FliD [Candidatus Margulisiibacteriota bacterium]